MDISRRTLTLVAVLIGAVALTLPSVAAAQATGTLTVDIVLSGDAGGDPAAVLLTVNRHSDGSFVESQPGDAGGNSFTLPAGSYDLVATVDDAAYVVTGQSCDSQAGSGPNDPDFIIDGTGPGGGGDASCIVEVTYTAPVITEPTTPPTEPEVPTTTTVDAGALPPAGGDAGTSALPSTGPSEQTLPIAAAALGMLVIGGAVMAATRRH